MALGDFPYPIVDLRLTHIAAGLNEVKSLKSCCLSANTIAEGLDPVYCPGATPAERLANLQADKQHTYWKNYNPPSCNCPDEYSPFGDECRKVSIEDVEDPPPFTPLQLIAMPFYQYTTLGVKVFSTYNLDGSGTSVLHTFPGDNFWQNNLGNYVDGAMNRTGIWTANRYNGQKIGFSHCIDIEEEKTFLVGFGVDNYVTIKVDGIPVMEMAPIENAVTFNYWYVYPVTIKAGFHILEVIASNVEWEAAIGMEIYDCTPDELMGTETQAELDPYTVFSTKDLFNKYTYSGTDGYPIREGFSLVMCAETPYYLKIEYADCE
jgi:hypothetical protein